MAKSLGEFTSDGAVWANGPGRLSHVTVRSDGTNDATAILYDNASAATGTKVFEGGVAGGDEARPFDFADAVRFKNGLYLDITGTGASVIVHVA